MGQSSQNNYEVLLPYNNFGNPKWYPIPQDRAKNLNFTCRYMTFISKEERGLGTNSK